MSTNARGRAALLASVPSGLQVNGERRASASGKTFDVEDPGHRVLFISLTGEPKMVRLP